MSNRALLGFSRWLSASIGYFLIIGYTNAKPVEADQVFGDWEIVRVLVPEGVANGQRFMRPDDPQLMGRKYSFGAKTFMRRNEEIQCTLDVSQAHQKFKVKSLFALERTASPKLVRDRFDKKPKDFFVGPKLASFLTESVAIYAYRCVTKDDREIQINPMGNWFARSQTTIIWPLAPDAFALLKKQPVIKVKAQQTFCETASSPSDKTICEDRELWLMKDFTDAFTACAIDRSANSKEALRDALAELLLKRDACAGLKQCVYAVLSQHKTRVAENIPSGNGCAEGVKR
jgi:hypothetical protein